MENNFGFDYYQYQHMLSNGPNLPGFPFRNGCLNPPRIPVSGLHQLKANVTDSTRNWNTLIETTPAQKRFLVFDQSGDKTTLLFSSGAHTPVQFGAYQVPNPPATFNLKEQTDTNDHLRSNLNGENAEEDYSRDVSEDEMHENTEELDALLCSDDDTAFSEDDEMSTGHSPSTMTEPNLVDEGEEEEEADSFSVPPKRRKLSSGNNYDESSLNTSSSSALESSCKDELGSWSGRKRWRKEKIHETVSILQSIVPNVNKKDDPIVVIDEAIQFLKSLKAKAEALGLDSI